MARKSMDTYDEVSRQIAKIREGSNVIWDLMFHRYDYVGQTDVDEEAAASDVERTNRDFGQVASESGLALMRTDAWKLKKAVY